MMGTREKLRGGDEYDALTRARRFFDWQPGHAASIKRRFWKRARKVARTQAKRYLACE